MSVPTIPPPRVIVDVEGLVALCVSDGRKNFDVGIIKGIKGDDEIPSHIHSIEIKKFEGSREIKEPPFPVRFDKSHPAKLLRLEMKEVGGTGIKLFHQQRPITEENRFDASKDFDLVVDVERSVNNNRSVGIDQRALRTVLRVVGLANAQFHTSSDSSEPLFIEDENGNPKDRSFGGALSVEGAMPLSAAASFQKYDEGSGQYVEVCSLVPAAGITYRILVKNDCGSNCSSDDITGFYNDLFAANAGGKKIRFKHPSEISLSVFLEVSPQTLCTPPDWGLTTNLPDPL